MQCPTILLILSQINMQTRGMTYALNISKVDMNHFCVQTLQTYAPSNNVHAGSWQSSPTMHLQIKKE